MEFSLGSQFSREFTFDESSISYDLAKKMNQHFDGKLYGGYVEKLYVGILCVSKGFEPFFKVKPPKFTKKIFSFEYEVKLDFEDFFNADKEQKKHIIIREYLKATKEVFEVKKIPGFDSGLFINDLEEFLKSY